jgi:hypothetical protein
LYSVLPQARGLRLQSSSWCARLFRAPTPTPHPPLPEASGFRWGLPYLLPTPLHILQEASRVHNAGLKQNAVGGVLLNAPSPLWGSPIFLQGSIRWTWSPMHSHPMEEAWGLRMSQRPSHRLDGLTSQARSVRGHVSRRARHASGDAPWHSSAKHHILEACFFRMTPFRSMLLTLQSGLQRLAPRAQSVPAYAQVLRHSCIALSRRTRISWWTHGPRMVKAVDPVISCFYTTFA